VYVFQALSWCIRLRTPWLHGPQFRIVIGLPAPDTSTGITKGRVKVFAGHSKMVTRGNVPKPNVVTASFEVPDDASRQKLVSGGVLMNPFYSDHALWYHDSCMALHMLSTSCAQGRHLCTVGCAGQVSPTHGPGVLPTMVILIARYVA
jgi:hypothetical protein